VIGGIGGRIAMRIVALASSMPVAFDPSASQQLLVQVAYRGATVGIAFVAIRRWLPRWRCGTEIGFGALLVVFMLAAALLTPWRGEFDQGPWLLGLALFALVVGSFGASTAWLTGVLERRFEQLGDGLPQTVVVSLIAALGITMGLLGFVSIAVKDLVSGS
jgi:cytochrome bd-type quinol oxidase subunit 1